MQFSLRSFDIYRKVPKDLTQPTTTGAVISISSIIFITYLVVSEALSFLRTDYISQMYVTDPHAAGSNDDRIYVRVSVVIPAMDCKYLGVDIQDDMGRHEVGHVEDVVKTPMTGENNVMGCRFRAAFRVNKVPGNFHIATHSAREKPTDGNMQHHIEYIVFGEDTPDLVMAKVPGSFNSLKGVSKMEEEAKATHDYFLKVVPSSIELISGKTYRPYQYSYAYRNYMAYGHGGQVVPAIWFRYDLSPITVAYKEQRRPFYHFLTMFCAIIGGTFTVASIIDSMIFTTHNWFKKAEIGKLG